jgi:flagellar hook protein FlgE
MMASLFAGVSGLKNHQVKMNVIGNNIANINTIGYKTSRVNFQEALIQTFKGAGRPTAISGGTNPIQLGLGMQVAAIDTLFQQGGLETTGQITDLAIQGSGFFVLGDANGNKFYTRAGAFGFDANSNLVDPATGLFVQGKMADATGNIPSLATTGAIQLPFGQQDPAHSTTSVALANNLNISATESDATMVRAGSSNVQNVTGTAEDGVGGTHTIAITGSQAMQSTFTGGLAGLTNDTLLGSGGLGITTLDDFSLMIDGTHTEEITGLTNTSTVADLVNAINLISGVSAELTAAGEVMITRDRAGSAGTYNFESSESLAGNIVNVIFGVPAGAGNTFLSVGGADATYIATDTFLPSVGTGAATGPKVSTLGLVIDEVTGMAIGLDGIGGGGISVNTGVGGLQATTPGNELVVDTESTTHSTSITVYDSLGGKHTLTIEFTKSIVNNRWEWKAITAGNESVSAGGTGFVAFNPDGSLANFEYVGGANSIVIDPGNGADNIDLELNVGSIGNYDGLTGFASTSHTATMIGQDGYGLGILNKIEFDEIGNISGVFSNGTTRRLAQILLADFSNQAGLRKAGRSMYQPSANSGEAIEGVAGSTVAATISSGALESSAVDIAQEFTSMITAQRGFQANARIISTSDSMLDDLVNIKR